MFKFSAALVTLCAFNLTAHAQVKLEWDFSKNKKFYVEAKTVNEQQIWAVQPTFSREDAARQVGTLMACITQPPVQRVPLQWMGSHLVHWTVLLSFVSMKRVFTKSYTRKPN